VTKHPPSRSRSAESYKSLISTQTITIKGDNLQTIVEQTPYFEKIREETFNRELFNQQIKNSEQMFINLTQCLRNSVFDWETFVGFLTELGQCVKRLASEISEQNSIQLVYLMKNLLQKGSNLKNDILNSKVRNEFIDALTELINFFKILRNDQTS